MLSAPVSLRRWLLVGLSLLLFALSLGFVAQVAASNPSLLLAPTAPQSLAAKSTPGADDSRAPQVTPTMPPDAIIVENDPPNFTHYSRPATPPGIWEQVSDPRFYWNGTAYQTCNNNPGHSGFTDAATWKTTETLNGQYDVYAYIPYDYASTSQATYFLGPRRDNSYIHPE